MNKIKSGIIGFALAIGVSGVANAGFLVPACEEASDKIDKALVRIDDANRNINHVGVHRRPIERMKLRKAIISITNARVALADCGVLPVRLELEDFDLSLFNPFEVMVDLGIASDEGNISNEAALRAARILTGHAILESYGPTDLDSKLELHMATHLLEWVQRHIAYHEYHEYE